MIDALEAELHRPLREIDAAAVRQRMTAWRNRSDGMMNFVPFMSIYLLESPSWPNPLHVVGERTLGQRDGLLVGIRARTAPPANGKLPKNAR